MTRTLSITLAITIMLTAGVNTEMLTVSAKTPTTISARVKTKSSPKKKKKQKHIHYMPKGNMGKWFKSKKELKKYAGIVMQKYNRRYENGEITWEEYVRRCPCGYEA